MAKAISWNYLINPLAQVAMIAVSAVLLYVMSALYLREAKILELRPSLQQESDVINNDKIKIKTGLFINNFLELDLIKNKFALVGIVWFEFNQQEVSRELLEEAIFSKADVKPQANLHDNLCGSATPVLRETQDGMTIAQYPVRIDFAANLDHKLYPFDSHRIYLTLNNMHLDRSKFNFVTDQNSLILSPNLVLHGWHVIDQKVLSGYSAKPVLGSNHQPVGYPRVIYALDLVRDSFKDILLLILPLIVLLYMSMFSFSYDHKVDRENILEIGVASVAAIVAYRFVIDTVAPNTPYFMLIDCLFALFLVLAFLVFLINVFDLFKNQRGLVVLTLHSMLLISWFGLLFIWG